MAFSKNEIKILVDAEVDKAIKNINKVEDTTKKSTSKMGSSIKKLRGVWIAAGAVIGGVVVAGLSKFVKAASDAQETLSKFSTVFKDVSKESETVAKNLSRDFGLSGVAAKKLLGDTGDLLTGFGFSGKAALDLSKDVNELAVDLASFTNFSGGAAGASAALTKALLGERESVKSLGISILEADVKAKVLKNTQEGLTFETERQAKAYATLQIAQEQSKNAIGDFSRTSKQFANQVRILRANFEDFAVSLGSKLLPVIAPLLTIVSDLFKKQSSLSDITSELIKANREYAEITNTLATESDRLTDAEKGKLEVRKAELKLDIVKSIIDLNKAYKEQTELVPKLEEQLKNTTSARENLGKQLVELTNLYENNTREFFAQGRTIEDLDAITTAYNSKLTEEAKLSKQIVDVNAEVNEGIETLSSGIKNSVISKGELLTVDKDLVAIATERAQSIEIEKDASVNADAEILASKILTSEQEKEIDKLKNEAFKLSEEELLQAKIDSLNIFLEEFTLNAEQQQGIVAAREEYERQQLELTDKKRRDNVNKAIDGTKKIFSYASQIAGDVVSIEKNKYDAINKDDITARAQQAERIKKAAKAEKALAITQTVIETAVSAQRAFSSLASIPVVGVGLGIAAAAAATVAGYVRVKKIESEPLPSFAKGGTMQSSGLAMVGEQGAELVNLPRGARVYNNGETNSIMNRNKTMNFSGSNFNLPNVTNKEEFMTFMAEFAEDRGVSI